MGLPGKPGIYVYQRKSITTNENEDFKTSFSMNTRVDTHISRPPHVQAGCGQKSLWNAACVAALWSWGSSSEAEARATGPRPRERAEQSPSPAGCSRSHLRLKGTTQGQVSESLMRLSWVWHVLRFLNVPWRSTQTKEKGTQWPQGAPPCQEQRSFPNTFQ